MRATTIVGIVLIVLGVLAFAFGGIRYTTHEQVLNIGPVHATAERHHLVPLPPLFGGIAIVGGIVLLIVSSRTRT